MPLQSRQKAPSIGTRLHGMHTGAMPRPDYGDPAKGQLKMSSPILRAAYLWANAIPVCERHPTLWLQIPNLKVRFPKDGHSMSVQVNKESEPKTTTKPSGKKLLNIMHWPSPCALNAYNRPEVDRIWDTNRTQRVQVPNI